MQDSRAVLTNAIHDLPCVVEIQYEVLVHYSCICVARAALLLYVSYPTCGTNHILDGTYCTPQDEGANAEQREREQLMLRKK